MHTQRVLSFLSPLYFDAEFKTCTTLEGRKTVLSMTTTVRNWKPLIARLRRFSFELYNSDIPLEEYYFFTEDLFPGASVSVTLDLNDRIKMITRIDDPFTTSTIPPLKRVSLEAVTTHSLQKKDAKVNAIRYNNRDYTIHDFISIFIHDDPDIIVSKNTHLIAILDAIRENHPNFSFSRFGNDIFTSKGHSFSSYGQVHYKDPPTYLKGRLHFSPTGVLYGKWKMDYPFELSRICRVPLQRMNHRSIGYGVANCQQYYAFLNKLLIPWKMTCVERWHSGMDLFNADRGSLIYEPRVGFHTNVTEIDFISLFPSIMVKENISPETLFCKCCKTHKVPGLNINICTKKDGLMRQLLQPIIDQRQNYKAQGKTDRANALKGMLVCCFGYMGFRKSKLARIECHQAILAYAREILLKTTRIAEEHGFEVVHGITDSLWVKGTGDLKRLVQAINTTIGLPIKVEGHYRWIVFLPSTQNRDVPVPTRYYGVFTNGEIKVRGIEIRRHDTPPFIKKMQEECIAVLAEATTEQEFMKQKQKSERILQSTINDVVTGFMTPEELCITIRLTKNEYKANIAQKQIIKELRQKGFTPEQGQYIKYIIQDRRKYSTATQTYCKKRYVALAKKAWRNLFLPFEKKEILYSIYDPSVIIFPRVD